MSRLANGIHPERFSAGDSQPSQHGGGYGGDRAELDRLADLGRRRQALLAGRRAVSAGAGTHGATPGGTTKSVTAKQSTVTRPTTHAASPASAYVAQMEAQRLAVVNTRRQKISAQTTHELTERVRDLRGQVASKDDELKRAAATLAKCQVDAEAVLQESKIAANDELARVRAELSDANRKLRSELQTERALRTAVERDFHNKVESVRREVHFDHARQYGDVNRELNAVQRRQGRYETDIINHWKGQVASAVEVKAKEKDAEFAEKARRMERKHGDDIRRLMQRIHELMAELEAIEAAPPKVVTVFRDGSAKGSYDSATASTDLENDIARLEDELSRVTAEKNKQRLEYQEQIDELRTNLRQSKDDVLTTRTSLQKEHLKAEMALRSQHDNEMVAKDADLVQLKEDNQRLVDGTEAARQEASRAAIDATESAWKLKNDKLLHENERLRRKNEDLFRRPTIGPDHIHRDEVDALKRRHIEELRQASKCATEEISAAQAATQKVKKDLERATQELGSLRETSAEELHATKKQVQDLRDEVGKLKRTAALDADEQAVRHKAQTTDLNFQIAALQKANVDKDDALAMVERKLEAQHQKFDEERQARQGEVETLTGRLLHQKVEMEEEQHKHGARLKEEGRKWQAKCDEAEEEAAKKLKSLKEKHDQERENLEEQLLQARRERSNMTLLHAGAEDSVKRIEGEVRQLHKELARLQPLEKTVAELKEEKVSLQGDLGECQETNKDLEEALALQKDLTAEATKHAGTLDEKVKQQYAEIDKAQADIIALRQQVDTVQGDHATAISEMETVRRRSTAQLASAQATKVTADELSEQARTLTAELEKSKEEIRQLAATIAKLEIMLADERARRLAAEAGLAEAQQATVEAYSAKRQAEESFEQKRLSISKQGQVAEARIAQDAAWQSHQVDLKLEAAHLENDNLRYFRQDLCDWINRTVTPSPKLNGETLLRDLSNGVVLCQLAQALDDEEQKIRDLDYLKKKAGLDKTAGSGKDKGKKKKLPPTPGSPSTPKGRFPPSRRQSRKDVYTPADATAKKSPIRELVAQRPIAPLEVLKTAVRGSIDARKNVLTFLAWARTLGLEDPDAFEVNDLLMYENPRRVLFGLYDVARHCRDSVPTFITIERQRYSPRNRSNVSATDPVDSFVNDMLSQCICNPRVEMTRMPDGMYMLAGVDKPLRLLSRGSKVVVRTGGGFDDFRQWLDKRDKCRHSAEANEKRQQFAEIQAERGALVDAAGEPAFAYFTNRIAGPSLSPGGKGQKGRRQSGRQSLSLSPPKP